MQPVTSFTPLSVNHRQYNKKTGFNDNRSNVSISAQEFTSGVSHEGQIKK